MRENAYLDRMTGRATQLGALFAVAVAVAGCGSVGEATPRSPARTEAGVASQDRGAARCHPARVRYDPYPGGDERMDRTPWVGGQPPESGLVGLLWYWPEQWRRQRLGEARIFTGGVVPGKWSTKILWAFVAPSAKGRGGDELVVEGRRIDGQGRFTQEFGAIGYAGQEGAPSYASIIDVPAPGCWRLELSTGELRAHIVFRAVTGGARS